MYMYIKFLIFDYLCGWSVVNLIMYPKIPDPVYLFHYSIFLHFTCYLPSLILSFFICFVFMVSTFDHPRRTISTGTMPPRVVHRL